MEMYTYIEYASAPGRSGDLIDAYIATWTGGRGCGQATSGGVRQLQVIINDETSRTRTLSAVVLARFLGFGSATSAV